jgi:membrane protease YdiL (CAAX protease family)
MIYNVIGMKSSLAVSKFGRVRQFVCRHPLVSFFAVAYIISWLGWVPYVLSLDGLGLLTFRFPRILGSTQFAGIMLGAYLGPLASAFFLTAMTEGPSGLRRWRRRLFRWRVGWAWYVLVLIGLPTVIVLATLPLPGAIEALRLPAATMFLAYVPFLVVQVFTTGVAEEPGWRDFALPRLQRRHGPLLGTVILGPLWAGWHLPLFLTAWAGDNFQVWAIPQFVLLAVVFSIVITWVFNRTKESLPLVMLLHASFNNFLSKGWPHFFPQLDARWSFAPVAGLGVVALLLVVVTRGRLGYSPETDVDTAGETWQNMPAIAPRPSLSVATSSDRLNQR